MSGARRWVDFPGGEDLLRAALPMAQRIAALKRRARAAGVSCIANEAHVRGFRGVVPRDCVASKREEDNAHALRQIERMPKAEVLPSERIDTGAPGGASDATAR